MKQILLSAILVAVTATVCAQVPQQINYQGRVSVQGVNFTGTGNFKFALLGALVNTSTTSTATPVINGLGDGQGPRILSITVTNAGSGYVDPPTVTINHPTASGATAHAVLDGAGAVSEIIVDNNGVGQGYGFSNTTVTLSAPPENFVPSTVWSNDGTSINGSAPIGAVGISVGNGLYSVRLGEIDLPNNMLASIPASVANSSALKLRVWFDDGTHGSQQLSPDQSLASVPWAIKAENAATAETATTATTVEDGAITADKIADGAVSSVKIAGGAVGSAQIAPGAVGPAQLSAPLAFRGPVVQYLICVSGGRFPSAQTPFLNTGDTTLGEIRMVAHTIVPDADAAWLPCDGRLLPIHLNTTLFALLGVRFGGNGTTHFALPDLRNTAPVGTP